MAVVVRRRTEPFCTQIQIQKQRTHTHTHTHTHTPIYRYLLSPPHTGSRYSTLRAQVSTCRRRRRRHRTWVRRRCAANHRQLMLLLLMMLPLLLPQISRPRGIQGIIVGCSYKPNECQQTMVRIVVVTTTTTTTMTARIASPWRRFSPLPPLLLQWAL
jgi:hypothetical protein